MEICAPSRVAASAITRGHRMRRRWPRGARRSAGIFERRRRCAPPDRPFEGM